MMNPNADAQKNFFEQRKRFYDELYEQKLKDEIAEELYKKFQVYFSAGSANADIKELLDLLKQLTGK